MHASLSPCGALLIQRIKMQDKKNRIKQLVVGGGYQRYAVDFERAIYACSAAPFSSCADDVLAILCLNAMHRQAVCEGPHSNSVGFLLHNTTACVTTIAGTIKPFRRVPYLNLGHNTPLSAIYSLFVVVPSSFSSSVLQSAAKQ